MKRNCVACGRIALGCEVSPRRPLCVVCGDTGEPSTFVNFPAGGFPPAPMHHYSFWRNEVARKILLRSIDATRADAAIAAACVRMIVLRERQWKALSQKRRSELRAAGFYPAISTGERAPC